MTKTLTEQWRDGKLPEDTYYVRFICGRYGVYEFEQYKGFGFDNDLAYIKEVLAPVPSYDEVKEMSQKIERLEFDNEALEMAHNEGKEINDELVSKTDELVQKIHILNEQNTKNYNELCEEIKKNNILKKKLKIATKALNGIRDVWANNPNKFSYIARIANRKAKTALEEMEGVK